MSLIFLGVLLMHAICVLPATDYAVRPALPLYDQPGVYKNKNVRVKAK